MDFKKELVKELGLGAIVEETMLADYVKACEAIAVRYHETKVKTLGLFSVSNCVLCEWCDEPATVHFHGHVACEEHSHYC